MNYYSLNSPGTFVDFKEATIRGQAPDKGLYFPQSIPSLPKQLLENIDTLSREELAFQVIRPYTGDTLPETQLRRIVRETIDFEFPLVKVSPGIQALELFHGPTLAFKDVGARFMSRCLGYFVKDSKRPVTVLVATSGDTGGAVASGFYGVEGVRVVILYPSGKVSSVQELQLTTLGQNITALEVDGSFDDCQTSLRRRNPPATTLPYLRQLDQRRPLATPAVLLFLRLAAMGGQDQPTRHLRPQRQLRQHLRRPARPSFWPPRKTFHRRHKRQRCDPHLPGYRRVQNKTRDTHALQCHGRR